MECEPVFNNGKEEEFGEQKYVTVEMLRRFCRNDAWLKKETERLEYLTPPAIRKRFSPVAVDEKNSYGFMNGEKNSIIFDQGESHTISVDFTDPNIVDMDLTTASIISKLEDGELDTKVITPFQEGNLDSTTKSGDKCNKYYKVCFNPNIEYHVRPNWLKNELNNEIPSIGRAQTFKAKKTGLLEAVTLNIHGSKDEDLHNTASPLIVQIRKTIQKGDVFYPDEVACDYDETYPVLAQQEIRFLNTQPEECNIIFDSPCLVTKDETYAIVVLSPLSHPTHCYWLGCYDKWYNEDYTDGDAFWTFDNGMSWNIHETIDFIFTAHIRETPNIYINEGEHYLYLKPIMHTGIISIEANCNDNDKVSYEASKNGREWIPLIKNQTLGSVEAPLNWDMCFIRAILSTDDENTPAYLSVMNLHINAESAKEMYVRTIPYYPKTSKMLGANVWGRVHAPFEVTDDAYCEAEIISMKETEEHFTIISISDLINYLYFDFIQDNKVQNKSDVQICNYLQDNWNVVERLKEENIYILPYTRPNDEIVYFFHEISFLNSPAYPIISCNISDSFYAEWIDYIYNYGDETLLKTVDGEDIEIHKDNLYFYDEVLQEMTPGILTVKYNPCYFKNLENLQVDGDGLTLDYYSEDIIISEENVESRSVKLQCCPVDPLRKVLLNDKELIEDVDFTVDYNKPCLNFTAHNRDDTIIKSKDKLNVVYTPNIDDTAISIGYYATREELNKQVWIKPNYLEYKA